MSWPSPQDYQEAMQNLRTALGDAELQKGSAELDQLDMPRPISGGFASVYKVFCPSKVWAVRCFLKEIPEQQQRYAAISKQLDMSNFPFATHFKFIGQGIRVRGNWHPILKMEWVQGDGLIRFINKNLNSAQTLVNLGLNIVEIVRALNNAKVAHGDLQHGNILVANGRPKLIDYDGMYVPALQGWKTHETGHPNFQLLRDESDFGPGLDNFSVWVIYLSLRVLSIRPALWAQFQGGDDCLLFRRSDFENPGQSAVLSELKRFPEAEIRQLASAFEALLAFAPLHVPLLDPGSPKVPVPTRPGVDWLRDHFPQPATPGVGVFDFAKRFAEIEKIPRPSQRYGTRPVVAPQQPRPWPVTGPIPVRPALPSILVSPPPFPEFRAPPTRYRRTNVPVESLEYSIGAAAVFFIALSPVMGIVGAIAGSSRPVMNAIVFGTAFLMAAGMFAVWWLVLEVNRRREEEDVNRQYQLEQQQLVALQQEHIARCTKQLREQLDEAQRKHDALMARWNIAILPYKQEASRRREAIQFAKSTLGVADQQMKDAWDAAARLFDQTKACVLALKNDWERLENKRQDELRQMLAKARRSQLDDHLRQHPIEFAAIENIGKKLKQKLMNSGIQTAFHVGYYRWPDGLACPTSTHR
jgi:hypothetical protein